ncbi:hypothetical protein LP420_18985 [Massilia sp. B-10]|nr:hypothetical protein LP420_18985 [Massilia sp. B-10]
MVIHSATHLFYDGEFDKGLRDLLDLHRLLTEFGATPGFWQVLLSAGPGTAAGAAPVLRPALHGAPAGNGHSARGDGGAGRRLAPVRRCWR